MYHPALPVRVAGLLILVLTLGRLAVHAQYRVFTWDSFEETQSTLPEHLVLGHYADAETVSAVPYSMLPKFPAIRTPLAEIENGLVALRFQPQPEKQHLSVVNKTFLERRRLGQLGSALVQADFYVPPVGTPWPNFAMLASDSDPAKEGNYHFYRFGTLDDRVYFSFSDGGERPKEYHQQPLSELNLFRPGWHRFQIVFYGQDRIYCAVDGQMTSFSPIIEPTLTRLSPGIMVTHREGAPNLPVVSDNLSIQWTPQPVSQLPISPWTRDPNAVAVVGGNNPKLMEADSPVAWRISPTEAWAESQSKNKPLLVMFCVPEIPSYKYLVDLCPNNESAKTWLSQFIPLRIDTNQLGGGQLAGRFNVFRVPTMMVLGPDGKERNRVTVIPNQTTWQDITALHN